METDDVMSDDEFEFDDSDNSSEIKVADDDTASGARTGGTIPVWRLIEMSRENRNLKQELADFDDYASEAGW
ncbi:MAG: hypothetical protein U5K76_10725 [Woeseiaceae bacterium]|nr:hypothetical protein [Woeseiaceae bacterium]